MQQKRLHTIPVALLLGTLLFISSTVLLQPSIAYAHAYVIGSNPVDGSTIASLPATLQIFFDAPISSASAAHVYAIENGQQVEVGISELGVNKERQLAIVLKNPESDPQGSYEITWSAVASDDGHITYGVIGFNIGQSTLGLSGTTILGPSTSNQLDDIRSLHTFSILSIVWDWFTLLALTLWLGILLSEQAIIGKVARLEMLTIKIKKQILSLQWFCLIVLLFSDGVSFFLRVNNFSNSQHESGLSVYDFSQLLLATHYGYFLLARLALFLLAFILLARRQAKQGTVVVMPEKTPRPEHRTGPLRTHNLPEIHTTGTANLTKERVEVKRTTTTPTPARSHPYIWQCLAGLIVLTYALSSEFPQLQPTPISGSIFEWLHLAAQGIWFGGLTYLAFLLLPALPGLERDPHAEALILLLQRFTPLLAVSMGITLLLSFYQAESSISALDQLLNDPYGRVLSVQSLLLLLLALLSLYTLFWLRSRLNRQALLLPVVNADLPARRTRQTALGQTEQWVKRVFKICALPGAAILLCTALMTFYTPPIKFPDVTYSNPPLPSTTTHTNQLQTRQIGDITAKLQVLPAKTGESNIVLVTLTDQQGTPVTDATVQLETTMEAMNMGVALKTIAPGRDVYAASFGGSEAFDMAGQWTIKLSIQRPKQSMLQTSFQVTIA